MHNYLTDKTADYIGATLSIPSTTVLPQTSRKSQIATGYDDGKMTVVDVSSASFFDIELQWAYISSTNYDTLMSFYHDSNKADGMRRTFYWLHPIDGYEYTVRFMGPLRVVAYPGNRTSVDAITLRVEGNKP